MPVSDALKQYRDSGYGGKKEDSGEGQKEKTSRVINLTDDEVKSLQPYAEKFQGDDIVAEVTGRLEGSHFHVMSVKYAEGGSGEPDVNADAEQVMAKYRMGPMVQSQTVPSPS